MAKFSVVLIGTKYTGNIGAVARVMKNFGLRDLILVEPPDIDDDALARSMHASDILLDAKIYYTLKEALNHHDMVVGTSGIGTVKEKHFLRHSEDPEYFASDILDYNGRVALLFGREDIGLKNEELRSCDRLITIPTSDDYPIMNLSHAVSVILYELYKGTNTSDEGETTGSLFSENKERLFDMFANILILAKYPEHKKERSEIMFRRILGRAKLKSNEYHRLMGVLSHIEERLI